MSNKKILLIALIIGLAGALFVGYIDYETTTIWSLFIWQNVPALMIYTLLFGLPVFFLMRLGMTIYDWIKGRMDIV